MAEIFISYAPKDREVGHAVAGNLERAGYAVWYDERDSLPTRTRVEQIFDAIDEAQAVVVIISRNALQWRRELELGIKQAYKLGKPITLVLRNIDYSELMSAQQSWSMILEEAGIIPIENGGVVAIMRMLLGQLKMRGARPGAGAIAGLATEWGLGQGIGVSPAQLPKLQASEEPSGVGAATRMRIPEVEPDRAAQQAALADSKHATPAHISPLIVARNQVFISYSRRDRRWLDQLQTVLRP